VKGSARRRTPAHRRRLDAEHLGEVSAQRKHALTVRPHGKLAFLLLRHGAN
jgi:hypothetical protein